MGFQPKAQEVIMSPETMRETAQRIERDMEALLHAATNPAAGDAYGVPRRAIKPFARRLNRILCDFEVLHAEANELGRQSTNQTVRSIVLGPDKDDPGGGGG